MNDQELYIVSLASLLSDLPFPPEWTRPSGAHYYDSVVARRVFLSLPSPTWQVCNQFH